MAPARGFHLQGLPHVEQRERRQTRRRARVGLRPIKGLKYHPNLRTRSLAGRNSSTLGVIVSTLENRFFFGIYKTLEADAHAKGFEAVMANTDYRAERYLTGFNNVKLSPVLLSRAYHGPYPARPIGHIMRFCGAPTARAP
jgi:DNA-binding LacI/PurR family transcriptional regulator